MERNMVIIPVVTKIDLPIAEPEKRRKEVADFLGVDESEIILSSAKSGEGTDEILKAIIERIPAPQGDLGGPLKALIFDSKYDSYQGVITYIRVMDGSIAKGNQFMMMARGHANEAEQLGIFNPKPEEVASLSVGEVGYIAANIKDIRDVKVGDTVTLAERPAKEPLEGYRDAKPMVFCGLYPINTADFAPLRDALGKLSLNDASFVYEPESSPSLGYGFRCGFLGLLHMEIAKERLEREFNLELIITAPNVVYRVIDTKGNATDLENPSDMPPPQQIERIEEPYIKAQIMIPSANLGAIMQFCQDRRGVYKSTE